MTYGRGDMRYDLAAISAAAAARGGIRSVARRAGVDAANCSRWLRTGRGLATTAISRLHAELGRPGGAIATDRVTRLAEYDPERLILALYWYMPLGCELVRSEWTAHSRARLAMTFWAHDSSRTLRMQRFGWRTAPN